MPKIDALLDDLARRSGRALHLSAGYQPLARIAGELVPLRDGLVDGNELEEVLLELLAPAQRGRLRTELELEFVHVHRGSARLRASYVHGTCGLRAIFHLLPSRGLTLTELGAPEALRRVADLRGGLVLVTGPAGSGKSTTMAAVLDHINTTRACHVLLIEEGSERVFESVRAQITQREVGVHATSVASAMLSAARENADVILLGELHAPETLSLAVELASSGILVFVTLRASGAQDAIERFVGAFPAEEQARMRRMLGDELVAIVAQQRVRTSDGKDHVVAYELAVGAPSLGAMVHPDPAAPSR